MKWWQILPSCWLTFCNVIFVLAAVRLWFFLLILSALRWRRLRGLCKLPNRRDWRWEKLGLALVGRALLSKALIQLYTDRWGSLPVSCLAWGDPALESAGSIVGIMAPPRGTFRDCCCQHPCPCGEPLLTHASTAGPPTLAGGLGSVSCGVTAPFLWVLVHATFCFWPPRLESLFPPVLWKSCSQIPLDFKVWFPGIPSPFVRSPGWEAWRGAQDLHNSGRTSLVLLSFSLWVTHPAGCDRDLILSWLCPCYCLAAASSLSLEVGICFWWVPAFSCQWLFNS